MSNPFANMTPAAATTPAAAPTETAPAANPNPFGAGGGATPQPASTPAANQSADPFGDIPDAPPAAGAMGIEDVGAVIVIKFKALEKKIPAPQFGPNATQDRMTCDVVFITGPRAGEVLEDKWVSWTRVVRQFEERVGDGRLYMVKLGKVGRAVTAEPVTDPALNTPEIKAKAASMMPA